MLGPQQDHRHLELALVVRPKPILHEQQLIKPMFKQINVYSNCGDIATNGSMHSSCERRNKHYHFVARINFDAFADRRCAMNNLWVWKRPHRRLSCRRLFSLINERNENITNEKKNKMLCSRFRSACNLSSAFSMRSRCEISKFGQFIIFIRFSFGSSGKLNFIKNSIDWFFSQNWYSIE